MSKYNFHAVEAVTEPHSTEAPTVRQAWEQWYALNPNFQDGEGDYYVTIVRERADGTEVYDAEAGVHRLTGKPFCRRHPDSGLVFSE